MMPYTDKAEYLEQVIPEYQGNPLIEALPDIWSGGQVIQMLSEKAAYNNGERKLDMQYRMHCIYRLFRYFQPLEQHIDIEQRISRSIRQGYLYRNPLTSEYAAGLADGYATMKDKTGYHALHGVKSAASGFTIIGVSGVGKSTAVEKILSLYPQRIVHTRYREMPLAFTQLVWLKLDCPHDGSLKQLCYQFFYALDLAAGTDYFQQYTKGRYSLDMLLIIMTQLVRQFQIGILVIDEIQHLSEAKGGGSDKMLNFFVTLVNTIGLPVVMIGTTKAMSILQGEFRQARRGSGQGDLIWDRMKKLGLVKPMLDALRSGDRKKILRYEDITPVSIEDYLSAYQAVKPEIQEKTTEKKLTVLEQTVVKLLEVDVDPPVAKRLAGKVIASHKNPVSVGEAFKEAYRLYISEVPDMQETEESREDLRESDGYEDIKRKGLILRNMEDRTECQELRYKYREEYLAIAQETTWLLEYGRKFGGYQPISSKYREFMKARDYADFHGTSINRDGLRHDFMEKYDEAFITELLPYGSGPWPCANKLCSHYRKDGAIQVEICKKRDEIWAWFECPHCGMRYRRSDPRQSFEEYLKKPCISNRGFIYEQHLKEYLSDPELSLNAIADLLGVGANTVGQYAKKNGIDVKKRRKASCYSCGADKSEGKTAYYKRRVQEELQKTPIMSCRDLKERVPGAYEWLIRKEPDWIHARLIHEFDKPRWNEWGEAALAELKAAYAEIQSSGDKRKRVTISWLARVAGINRDDIYGRLRYLPEMQKFFDDVCETRSTNYDR